MPKDAYQQCVSAIGDELFDGISSTLDLSPRPAVQSAICLDVAQSNNLFTQECIG